MAEAEELLVEKCKKGDFHACEELVNRFERRIYNHALRILSDPSEAEEVLQDTFLNAFKNIDKYSSDGGFDRWLYKIATNNCLMRVRKKKAQPTVCLDEPLQLGDSSIQTEVADWSTQPDQALLNDEVKELINKAISQLPEDHRVVLLLHDIEGLSNNEIVDVLGLSLPAVKSRLHRARLFIRSELCKYLGKC